MNTFEHSTNPNETQTGNTAVSLEALHKLMAERIESASNNPIKSDHLKELEQRLSLIADRYIETGAHNEKDTAEEAVIEAEILRSTAVAHTLAEFKILLDQLSTRYGEQYQWTEKFLAHENAHANVAEATGHQWVGYGAVFIADTERQLSGIQVLHFTKTQLEWGPKEMLSKSIAVTEAPSVYGDTLSESDVMQIEANTKKLNELQKRQSKDTERLPDVKAEFGISE